MSRSFLVDSLILKKPHIREDSERRSPLERSLVNRSPPGHSPHPNRTGHRSPPRLSGHHLSDHHPALGSCFPRTPADVMGLYTNNCPLCVHPSGQLISAAPTSIPLMKPLTTVISSPTLHSSPSYPIPSRPRLDIPRKSPGQRALTSMPSPDYTAVDPRRLRYVSLGQYSFSINIRSKIFVTYRLNVKWLNHNDGILSNRPCKRETKKGNCLLSD